MPTTNITGERAARRFEQIARLEHFLQLKDRDIVQVTAALKMLKEEQAALLNRLRTAARDEGELPLFELDSEEEEGR